MARPFHLALAVLLSAPAFALQGGPDLYGYIWKDSNEPGGPVFNWIDITGFGTQVTGLADDNVAGPFVMQTNQPFYWYAPKKIWIGSNGYIAFNNVQIASPFPLIPQAFPPNDYIAAMTADLNFSGVGNPAQCWFYDDPSTTIVSYIDVPFWTDLAPSYTGENTFQVILNKADSTVTIQYLEQTGFAYTTDLLVGVESLTGDIGLQHSADAYPPINYAVRFYAPAVPLIDVIDASVDWVTDETSQGLSLKRNGPLFPLTINVHNTGNQPITDLTATGTVYNSIGSVVATASQPIDSLATGIDTTITFAAAFDPVQAGTYRFQGSVTGVLGETVTSNNVRDQELAVYDTTLSTQVLDWAGPTDDGAGIGWAGGNAGVGAQLIPAWYPAYVTGITIRISTNTTPPSGFVLRLYDDDGPNGTHGTLLDSINVPGSSATIGDHVFPVTTPFFINDGTVYLEWLMMGTFVNIAQDIVPPFSYRTYEVLGGVWAQYRDIETADFHLGLQISQVPVQDVGCTGYFGLIPGLDVSAPTSVRTWVKNFGNVTMNNFPVNYRFDGDPVVTQNYTGPVLAPGDSSLFTFSQLFTPTQDLTADLCAWTGDPDDVEFANDTVCVSIDAMVGIGEAAGLAIELSPNPAKDVLLIQGLPDGMFEAGLFDLGGQLVLWHRDRASGPVALDLEAIAQGTYVLHLIGGDHLFHAKVIVQR